MVLFSPSEDVLLLVSQEMSKLRHEPSYEIGRVFWEGNLCVHEPFFLVMSGGWELLCQDKLHRNPLLDIYSEIPVFCLFPDLGQSPTGTGVLGSVCCRAVSHLRQ